MKEFVCEVIQGRESPIVVAMGEEVVRCADCGNSRGGAEHRWCELNECRVKPDDFCSWGERSGR